MEYKNIFLNTCTFSSCITGYEDAHVTKKKVKKQTLHCIFAAALIRLQHKMQSFSHCCHYTQGATWGNLFNMSKSSLHLI